MLRNQYTGFADMDTEYDTINEVYAQWAGYGEPTLSHNILNQFAARMTQTGMDNPLDASFVMQIMGSGNKALPRNVIQTYLSARLQTPYSDCANRDLYEGLAAVLHKGRNTKPHGRERAQETEKRTAYGNRQFSGQIQKKNAAACKADDTVTGNHEGGDRWNQSHILT